MKPYGPKHLELQNMIQNRPPYRAAAPSFTGVGSLA